ncbi:MAG: mannuronate-specific alginate lyase [Ketobacteraceae bacterium]|nr:mannuronate-specific alginate lyase [Ketobacteraceae bacterium]
MHKVSLFTVANKAFICIGIVMFSINGHCASQTGSKGGPEPPAIYRLPVAEHIGKTKCKSMPAPHVGSLDLTSKYRGSGSSRDALNKKAEAEYKEASKRVNRFEKALANLSDKYLEGDPFARDCAVQLLEYWAVNNALMSDEASNTGHAVRKWALATAAHTYIKLVYPANARPLSANSKAAIESWFSRLADKVQAYYSDRPLKKVNNHDYWAAWSVMLTGVITGNEAFFEWAMKKYQVATSQIEASGYLPNEMRRATRALAYHNYALHPLVWMTAFAAVNGRLTKEDTQAIQRLVSATVAGLHDPRIFEEQTGKEQALERLYTAHQLAWMEVWVQMYPPVPEMNRYLKEHRPMKASRLGGDISLLFGTAGPRPHTRIELNTN